MESAYTFDTTGNHTVKYKLKNSTTIGSFAFSRCFNITSITISNTVTAITGRNTFSNCWGLTNINIPNTITSFGEWMTFINCSGLTSITIPDSITNIGKEIFAGCTSLTSISIPSGVTSIGDSAFEDCSSLTSITVNATTPPTLGNYPFASTNNCPIYVPCDSVDAYKTASIWSSYASRIQAIPGSCP